ncbi:MAG: hypothetical protein K2X68_04045 [Novosphingobium sp.]|nr:hypothetical protein [Novosphingobium sp.]
MRIRIERPAENKAVSDRRPQPDHTLPEPDERDREAMAKGYAYKVISGKGEKVYALNLSDANDMARKLRHGETPTQIEPLPWERKS